MANFKLFEIDQDISSFDLPLNRTVKLRQWGGDGKNNQLDVALNSSTTDIEVNVLPDKTAAASTIFTALGRKKGATANVSAYLKDSKRTQTYSEDLKLRVMGEPKKHTGYDVDMLSDLAIKGNGKQIWDYSRVINGPSTNAHMLSQNTEKGKFNCGDVAAGYGKKLFAKEAYTPYYTYYLPPTSDKMADLRFDEKAMRKRVARIKGLVDDNIPVRLWMIHADGFKKVIQGDWRSHFLTVIGYSATRFLYIDPWPTGSILKYEGGMYDPTDVAFLGELEFDMSSLANGIRSPSGFKGAHNYTVIAGPN
ncbi:C39 family peptidase [Mesorhizobium sp. IMUNJ 23232]|uniref:C39 family peptidase n=1 Tax=Mesorhizobium sp. IMUNJ 23232 TaxID=3376064 RepID=UPI0037914A9C